MCGGPVALVQAPLDTLGEGGTLAVPTHSGDNSDPSGWSNPPVPRPWWPAIRASTPAYDPPTTPSRGAGVVPETVRTWPGALRSAHPQTAFAALGPGARAVVEDHAIDYRLGERSPLARLEEAGARVLMLGTGYGSRTAFHLAEYRIPGPAVRNSFAALTASGRRWTTVTDTPVSDEGFEALGADFERPHPVVRGTAGGAEARLFPLAGAVAHAERRLPVHRPRDAA